MILLRRWELVKHCFILKNLANVTTQYFRTCTPQTPQSTILDNGTQLQNRGDFHNAPSWLTHATVLWEHAMGSSSFTFTAEALVASIGWKSNVLGMIWPTAQNKNRGKWFNPNWIRHDCFGYKSWWPGAHLSEFSTKKALGIFVAKCKCVTVPVVL